MILSSAFFAPPKPFLRLNYFSSYSLSKQANQFLFGNRTHSEIVTQFTCFYSTGTSLNTRITQNVRVRVLSSGRFYKRKRCSGCEVDICDNALRLAFFGDSKGSLKVGTKKRLITAIL